MSDTYSFKISIPYKGKQTEFDVVSHADKDHILYEINDKALTCLLGINEHGKWEANCDIDENTVAELAKAIVLEEQNTNQTN